MQNAQRNTREDLIQARVYAWYDDNQQQSTIKRTEQDVPTLYKMW